MRCLKIILPVAVIIVFVIGVFGLQGNRMDLMEEIESQEALIRDYDDRVSALEDSLDLARQQVVAANEELEAAMQEVEKVRQEENTAYQELERVTTQAGYGKEETWPREGDGQYDGKPIEVNNLPVSFYVVTEKILLENETQSLCKMYFERPVFYPNPSEEESDEVREALKKINASLEKECQVFFEGRDYFFDFQSDEIVESYRNLGSMYFNTANISEIYYDEAGYLFLIWGDDWYAGGVYNGGLRPVCFSIHTGERVYLPEALALSEAEIRELVIDKIEKYYAGGSNYREDEEYMIEWVREADIKDFLFYMKDEHVYLCFGDYMLERTSSELQIK